MKIYMEMEEIKERLNKLNPEIAWSHQFELGNNLFTIAPENEKYYKKSIGLAKLSPLISNIVEKHTIKGTLNGLKVVDIACGEGAHSIYMADKGATVFGIEGRQLYVERARLMTEIFQVKNFTICHKDCRHIDSIEMGKFDLVLCSGILHHLDIESFTKFIKNLKDLTADTLVIYSHVSNADTIKNFNLTGPVFARMSDSFFSKKYKGYLFQEHNIKASNEEKANKVRASLDNTYSFWPTFKSLVRALADVGFVDIKASGDTHIFNDPKKIASRPILIARVKQPK